MIESKKSENGQVMTEYAIMLAMFAGIAVMLVLLLAIFTEYGWRIVYLTCSHDVATEKWIEL